ncbi:MAG: phosphoribosylanthranilate isomerase [Crocosphaera sp.]|nr:phosphoribosylanthranilate isomerase [Crocosphaera sp.]
MRIKICGIKTVEDACLAIEQGADAIGLLVGKRHYSEDFISEDLAKKITKACPPYTSPVLVTHLKDWREIYNLATYISVTTIQIHSNCELDTVIRLQEKIPYIKIVKSLHANQLETHQNIEVFEDYVDAFIVDTINMEEGRVGGTGLTHDWNISKNIVEQTKCKVILAGGLNPDNIADAIRKVNPFGVDANSGLKNKEGLKDKKKISDFISKAKLEFIQLKNKCSNSSQLL